MFKPIIDTNEGGKAKGRLKHLLHLASYYLNSYYYMDEVIQEDSDVRTPAMYYLDAL